ncbi:MAG: hypothetical protein E2O39_16685 [Planctomycetota bacterium]|nr:MAG: hypothetical protein E2O39_16685 [Planctomycetota bacterium]
MLSLAPILLAIFPVHWPSIHVPRPEPAPAPTADRELFAIYYAGADALLVDPKDEGLRRALNYIDERLAELPAEFDAEGIPPDVLPLVTRLCRGPLNLLVGLADDLDTPLPVPIFGQLELLGESAEDAAALAARFGRLLALSGMPAGAVAPNGLTRITAPLPAWYGTRDGDFVLAVGKTDGGRPSFANTGLPPDVELALAGRFDYGAFMGLVTQFAVGEGEELDPFLDVMAELGLDDLRFEWGMGVDEQRLHAVMTLRGYAAAMQAKGLLPESPIAVADFTVVPEDATWAMLGVTNFAATFEVMRGLIEEQMVEMGLGGDPVELLAGFTGIHLERDILDHLGSTWGMYASDTTGGGGVFSLVAFIELADVEGITATKERVEDMLNGIALAQAEGYVKIRQWEHGGTDFSSITFPGLPVPFEPTVAFTSRFLFIGFTPQATLGAVLQAEGGGRNLLDNPRFRAQLDGGPEGLFAVSFIDTPRLIREGYGVTSMLCSALVNGTRSPRDSTRDAGLILPPYHELVDGALAIVSASRIEGDDLVQRTHADRSMLVNMAGGIGYLASHPAMMALPVVLVGGVMTARGQQAVISPMPFEIAPEPIPVGDDEADDR